MAYTHNRCAEHLDVHLRENQVAPPPYQHPMSPFSDSIRASGSSGAPGGPVFYEVQPRHTQTCVDPKQAALKAFFSKYEISPTFQEDIECVKQYDIVVIADDSSSMADPSEYFSFKDNRFVKKTRWDELQETIEVIAELGVILDDDGIDIWFLNVSTSVKNVVSKETVMQHFNRVPRGRTPLTAVLRKVMQEPSASGKPKLILIATDGEPNDDDGYDDSDNFLHLLKTRDVNRNRVGILVCTSSDKQMAWLERVDTEAEHVDVIDDYLSERDQILKVQGSDFTYSHGDHVLKMLLGPVLQKYDDMDEKPLKRITRYVPEQNKNTQVQNYGGSVGSKKKKHNKCVIL